MTDLKKCTPSATPRGIQPAGGAWFRSFGSKSTPRLRLIGFHHAGGDPHGFATWQRHLPPWLQVVAVELPGRGRRVREAAVPSLEGLADALASQWTDAWGRLGDDLPFVLYGHSMGALLSFEVARRLHDRGIRALGLIASGAAAPHVRPSDTHGDRSDAALIGDLRRLGGTPEAVLQQAELMELTLRKMRADYHALDSYRWTPGPRLDCPLWVVGGNADPLVDARGLRAWAQLTSASFRIRTFAGGHFFMDTNTDFFAWLAQVLDTCAPFDARYAPAGGLQR